MKGYLMIADQAKSPPLTRLLVIYARQRKELIKELQHEVKVFDRDTLIGGTWQIGLNDNWATLDKLDTTEHTILLLEKCIHEEKKVLEKYAIALCDKSNPHSTRNTLNRQRNKIKQSISDLISLRNSLT